MWMGIIWSFECQKKNKRWRKYKLVLSLLELRHSSSPLLAHQCSWSSCFDSEADLFIQNMLAFSLVTLSLIHRNYTYLCVCICISICTHILCICLLGHTYLYTDVCLAETSSTNQYPFPCSMCRITISYSLSSFLFNAGQECLNPAIH